MTARSPRPSLIGVLAVTLLVIGVLPPSQAVEGWAEELRNAPALGDPDLEAIRGGFETDTGMQISFGVEQITSINGVLQARMAFFVPDLTDPAGVTTDEWASKVIQNGPGNTFTLNPTEQIPSQVLTIIQNSLDQQVIQHLTVVDLTLSGVSVGRDAYLQSFLNQPRF